MVKGETIWTAGTLRYTKGGLIVLFVWLLGNDLCLMLMEQVAPQLTPLLLKNHGASNQDIAFYTATLGTALTIWINPFVSTWSDRHRGPYGRRRPFLLFAAPICAVLLAAIPCVPHLAGFFGLSATSGVIMLIGACYIAYAVFNSVILAIFNYYFWDVVPEPLLGRFTSLTKVVSTIATFIWNYFLFGLAEKHMEVIYIGVAAFFLVLYLLSLWQVKEGDYPPPDVRQKKGLFASVRIYLVECFGQSYYLWVYGAMAAYQVGNLSSVVYQNFYLMDSLGLSWDIIGKMRAWPAVLIVLLAYPLGVLIDRLKPVRMVPPALLLWSLVNLFSFFYLRDPLSLLICSSLMAIASFIFAVSFAVMNVEVFPREKLGQFCSATAITYQIICILVAVPLGMLFDHLKDYRYTYLWSSLFDALAALLFFKVYCNWKRVRGHTHLD